MKFHVRILILALIVVVGGFFIFNRTPAPQSQTSQVADGNPTFPVSEPPAPSPVPLPSTSSGPPAAASATNTKAVIHYDGSAFTPNTITVKKGTMVTFMNNSSDTFWPASNPHPAHTGYPEKGGCINSAFDACKAVPAGASWLFTFNVVGTWKYHDHLNPMSRGIVVVE
jgi:plastocyanin